mmetsp:Transcript_25733/g.64350  ORF Transcript_25733/g.64350 Transcript_25733/m.64350 type:complete len:204 (+) Transcript_25733:1561-2172(+)
MWGDAKKDALAEGRGSNMTTCWAGSAATSAAACAAAFASTFAAAAIPAAHVATRSFGGSLAASSSVRCLHHVPRCTTWVLIAAWVSLLRHGKSRHDSSRSSHPAEEDTETVPAAGRSPKMPPRPWLCSRLVPLTPAPTSGTVSAPKKSAGPMTPTSCWCARCLSVARYPPLPLSADMCSGALAAAAAADAAAPRKDGDGGDAP